MHRSAACAVLALFCGALPALADPVDGSTADWGRIENHASDPHKLVYDFRDGVSAFVEDTGNRNRVGPGYGGHDYDVKALFLRQEDTVLYGGLLTGFDLAAGEPLPGSHHRIFAPGDFLLDFGCDGGYDLALDLSSYDGTSVDLVRLAGDNSDLDPVVYASHRVSGPWAWNPSRGGTVLGRVRAYRGPAADLAGDFQFFEFGLDVSLFPVPEAAVPGSICANWTMECGNDYGHARLAWQATPVPEPGTLALLGAAAVGVAVMRRRRKKQVGRAADRGSARPGDPTP